MSEIIKTDAVILSKMKFRETSKIAVLYTRSHGRITVLIKGARTAKSPVGLKIDPLNYLQVVIYLNNNREIQLLTQADIIEHHPRIKEDLNKLKYATAATELMQQLTMEGDVNPRLFQGLVRILHLFNSSDETPSILLLKFMTFFLKEIGYELQTEHCSSCLEPFEADSPAYFNYENGFVCGNCRNEIAEVIGIRKELFNFFKCLRNSKNNANDTRGSGTLSPHEAEKAVLFLEKYIKYHVPEFKGIRSIHLF